MQSNDPSLKSFVEVMTDSHFPIQNLPFGVFSTAADPTQRVGVAIGDQILDLAVLEESSLLTADPAGSRVFNRPSLNGFIALGQSVWREVRASVSELLRHDSPRLRDDQNLRARALVPMAEATLHPMSSN
jgi:fumarylacetoacetase